MIKGLHSANMSGHAQGVSNAKYHFAGPATAALLLAPLVMSTRKHFLEMAPCMILFVFFQARSSSELLGACSQ